MLWYMLAHVPVISKELLSRVGYQSIKSSFIRSSVAGTIVVIGSSCASSITAACLCSWRSIPRVVVILEFLRS